MGKFHFEGRLPSSKSLLNRALIIRSYKSTLQIRGETDAEDVTFLRKSTAKIEDGKEFYLGDGGTSLRFFTLRCAREKGSFVLKGTDRLFRRPQLALKEICDQLGVHLDFSVPAQVRVQSEGWQQPAGPLRIPTGESSQFASAVVLNSWDLPFDLELIFDGSVTSASYLRMTLDLCAQMGLRFEESAGRLLIPAGQKITGEQIAVEPDVSSLFSLATLAALNGEARFFEIPQKSLQPDLAFIDIFRAMGVPVEWDAGTLVVRKAGALVAGRWDLSLCPDLVPVLSVICAFAEGVSVLYGAPQLRHKESDRIQSAAKLLKAMGVKVVERPDGLEITGQPGLRPGTFDFDPDKDHRLAMAAGILNEIGWNIRIRDPDVVRKSFPEFWSLLKAGPHLLVGHRGTGKTSLMRRMAPSNSVDLDEEIERRSGQPVFELFKNRGEEIFRQWELTTIKEILREAGPHTWISVGAGLRLDEVEFRGEIIWVRRDTDREGRVFLDRPRLDPSTDPLVEFRQRAKAREPIFARSADRTYTMPEGLAESDELEKKILCGDLEGTGGVVTLFPSHRRTLPQLGAHLYELRDDLLESEELMGLFHKFPEEKILYSVRKNKFVPEYVRRSKCLIDWGLDGSYPDKEFVEEFADRLILSSHGSHREALLDFRLYAKFPVRFKLSPVIESYDDLREVHQWWAQDPTHRHLLPRSSDGRWGWYRLWMKGKSAINFWREGGGSAEDQPTLYQWLASPFGVERFAAVLGAPVAHSWSPTEHRHFFAKFGMPMWAVEVREGEWDRAMPFLRELGLQFASVTAPLKGKAFRLCKPSELAAELESVNTLAWDEQASQWRGHNTDLTGLAEAVLGLPSGPVAVWGGGGTLPVIGRVLPNSSAFSATKGHLRSGSKELQDLPKIVVWAAPRGSELMWPPDHWKPEIVFDLNYKEDSPGREYALRIKARYVSGEKMFRAQAREQREYWKTFLEPKK